MAWPLSFFSVFFFGGEGGRWGLDFSVYASFYRAVPSVVFLQIVGGCREGERDHGLMLSGILSRWKWQLYNWCLTGSTHVTCDIVDHEFLHIYADTILRLLQKAHSKNLFPHGKWYKMYIKSTVYIKARTH